MESLEGITRKCYRCKQVKPITEFRKARKEEYGYGYSCKPCNNAMSREWKAKNPEYVKERDRRWLVEHPDYMKKWIQEHPGYNREYYLRWIQDNSEKVKEHSRRRISFKGKPVLLIENPRTGICTFCEKTEQEEGKQLAMHHILYDKEDPSAHTMELCQSCNMKLHRSVK